jgi:hypothetical protein
MGQDTVDSARRADSTTTPLPFGSPTAKPGCGQWVAQPGFTGPGTSPTPPSAPRRGRGRAPHGQDRRAGLHRDGAARGRALPRKDSEKGGESHE